MPESTPSPRPGIVLKTVEFGALVEKTSPFADTMRRLAEWEHDGHLGHAGGNMVLLANQQWSALATVITVAGLDDSNAVWFVDDPRHETAATAMRDLYRDVRRGRLGGHWTPATIDNDNDSLIFDYQEGPDLTFPVLAKRLAVAVELLREAAQIRHATSTETLVDLEQIAAVVHLQKRTMENYKRRREDPLPEPDCPGGGGRKDFWYWNTIRPWLIRNFNLPIPEQFPDIHRRH